MKIAIKPTQLSGRLRERMALELLHTLTMTWGHRRLPAAPPYEKLADTAVRLADSLIDRLAEPKEVQADER